MDHSPIDYDPTPKLRRRDVLAYGAGLALLPSFSWAGQQSSGAPLAIGYCPEATGDLDGELPAASAIAATRLAAGEPQLANRGARLTVHGLTGGAGALARLGIRSAELKVGFLVAGTGAPEVEFLAWSHQLLPVLNAGTANSFAVPVERGLKLVLEVETFGNERFETLLVTGREPGAPKLRAGLYLIAPGAARFSARSFDPAAPEPFVALSVEPLA